MPTFTERELSQLANQVTEQLKEVQHKQCKGCSWYQENTQTCHSPHCHKIPNYGGNQDTSFK